MGKILKQDKLYKKAAFLDKASRKPDLVNLPFKIKNMDEYTTGILAMRHMETYMGVPNEQWEDTMTARNKDRCIKAMRIKYCHTIISSVTNTVRNQALKMISKNPPKPRS